MISGILFLRDPARGGRATKRFCSPRYAVLATVEACGSQISVAVLFY